MNGSCRLRPYPPVGDLQPVHFPVIVQNEIIESRDIFRHPEHPHQEKCGKAEKTQETDCASQQQIAPLKDSSPFAVIFTQRFYRLCVRRLLRNVNAENHSLLIPFLFTVSKLTAEDNRQICQKKYDKHQNIHDPAPLLLPSRLRSAAPFRCSASRGFIRRYICPHRSRNDSSPTPCKHASAARSSSSSASLSRKRESAFRVRTGAATAPLRRSISINPSDFKI